MGMSNATEGIEEHWMSEVWPEPAAEQWTTLFPKLENSGKVLYYHSDGARQSVSCRGSFLVGDSSGG